MPGSQAARMIVAKRIIDLVREGDTDPDHLCEATLKTLGFGPQRRSMKRPLFGGVALLRARSMGQPENSDSGEHLCPIYLQRLFRSPDRYSAITGTYVLS